MKKNNKISLLAMLIAIISLGVFNSCNEDQVSLKLPYLFRPVNFTGTTNGVTPVVTISWAKVDSAVSYTLKVSTDSVNFTNPVIDVTISTNSYVQELAGNTTFYAEVKANAADTTKNSKFNKTSFKTPKENIFLGYGTSINTGQPISAYMTAVHSLEIKWRPAANVTHLILTAPGQPRDSVVISAAEAASGDKIVGSLANSNWKVDIYNGVIPRGTIQGTVEGDVILNDGDNLQAALAAATPGQIIVLAGSGNYTVGSGANTINTNIKVRGISPVNRPVVCMTGAAGTAVMFAFGTNPISSIKMENIDFTGYNDNNTTGTEIQYMFNNGTVAKVSNLSFTNCKIRDFSNTPFRLKNGVAQVIDTLAINGCIIKNVGFGGTYAVINSNTNDLFNTILLSNSTIYNFKNSLILRTGSTLNAVSVINCNINQGMQDNTSPRYLMDFNTATFAAAGGITIKNSIFGSTGGTLGANGIRFSNAPKMSISGYYTSDYVDDLVTQPTGYVSSSIKQYLTPYPNPSIALWIDPVNGNFSLKDTSFAGKGVAGDLRW